MYTHENTLVIVLTTDGYSSVIDGSVFQSFPHKQGGTELFNKYMNTCKGIYVFLANNEACKPDEAIFVAHQIIKQENLKVSEQPKKDDTIQEEPNEQFNLIAPPLMLPEHKTIKSRIMENSKNVTRKASYVAKKGYVGTKVGIAGVIDIATTVGYIGLKMSADAVNYVGASAIVALNVYDQTVKENMAAREKKCDQVEEALLRAPKAIRDKAQAYASKRRAEKRKLQAV